jgi:hypothetical protein
LPYERSGNASGQVLQPKDSQPVPQLNRGQDNADERTRVLKVLAQEWGAFMRDCRMASAIHVGSKDIAF